MIVLLPEQDKCFHSLRSVERARYLGRCSSLPVCVQGRTGRQRIASLDGSVSNWLRGCLKNGR